MSMRIRAERWTMARAFRAVGETASGYRAATAKSLQHVHVSVLPSGMGPFSFVLAKGSGCVHVHSVLAFDMICA